MEYLQRAREWIGDVWETSEESKIAKPYLESPSPTCGSVAKRNTIAADSIHGHKYPMYGPQNAVGGYIFPSQQPMISAGILQQNKIKMDSYVRRSQQYVN